MRNRISYIILWSLLLTFASTWCHADTDWKIVQQLNLPATPKDIKFSRDGQWLYILMDKGELIVYDYKGEFKAKIPVGPQVDAIEPGAFENQIYLLSRSSNQIKVIEVSHSRQIETSGSPFKGAADAPVEIVEYTDFQCPYCAKLVDIFKTLMQTYPGKLKIVYKSYPLSNHKFAYRAASAAMAAHRKGRFWEFHDRLFENHKSLDDAKLTELRKEFGFDTPEFIKLTKSPEIRAQVAKDRREGQRIGVRGTPAIFINGKRLKDKRIEGFKAAIEKELKNKQVSK